MKTFNRNYLSLLLLFVSFLVNGQDTSSFVVQINSSLKNLDSNSTSIDYTVYFRDTTNWDFDILLKPKLYTYYNPESGNLRIPQNLGQ